MADTKQQTNQEPTPPVTTTAPVAPPPTKHAPISTPIAPTPMDIGVAPISVASVPIPVASNAIGVKTKAEASGSSDPVKKETPMKAQSVPAIPSMKEEEQGAIQMQAARLSSPKLPSKQSPATGQANAAEGAKKDGKKPERPKRPEKVMTQAEIDKKEKAKSSGSKFLNIGVREKIMFAKHLGVMLDSGIPLKEALEVMEGQVSSKPMRRMLTVMIRDLSDGFTLSSTLEKFPRVFKPFSVNIIRVGESSGTLPNALHYQGIQLEKAHELEGKIKGALLYPIIIFVGAIGIACYLSFYILPKMLPMFTSMNVKLPPTTRALLDTSQFIVHQWPILLAALVGIVVLSILLYKIKRIKYFIHNLLIHLPIFGVMVRAVQVAFFTRILGILLTSGVQIVQAIGVAAESASNLVFQKTIRIVAEEVERGEAITDELEKNPHLFPKITTGMIKVGDRTGRLAESLMNAAEFSEKEVDDMTKTLSTLIEPITLLLVGGLVGFIALSVITPIYQITQGIGRG
ncbi:MAG: type II secretion system F family protein [Patescibacteria group bacterium]